MGIVDGIKSIKAVQTIKNGGTADLSYAMITNLIINMPDAKRNLSTEQYQAVYDLFFDYQSRKEKIQMDADAYIEAACEIIQRFDEVAPYELYSGGNAQEYSEMMAELRRIRQERPKSLNELIERVQQQYPHEQVCPDCGKTNRAEASYCRYCGRSMQHSDSIVTNSVDEAHNNRLESGQSCVNNKTDLEPETSKLVEMLNGKLDKWKKAFWSILAIVIVIIFVMVAIAISEYRDLEDKYNVLVQENAWYGNNNKALSDKVDKYDKQIDILKKQLEGYKSQVYDAIFSFSPEKQYKDFYASAEVLVIKKGEKKTLYIYLTRNAAVNWEWDGSICSSANDYGDWETDKGDNYFPVYIEGLSAGTSTYTFSNTYNKEKIKVLVIVVE